MGEFGRCFLRIRSVQKVLWFDLMRDGNISINIKGKLAQLHISAEFGTFPLCFSHKLSRQRLSAALFCPVLTSFIFTMSVSTCSLCSSNTRALVCCCGSGLKTVKKTNKRFTDLHCKNSFKFDQNENQQNQKYLLLRRQSRSFPECNLKMPNFGPT